MGNIETNSAASAQRSMLIPEEKSALGGWSKRVVDSIVAAAALVAFLPLFILLCIAIKLSSPGPVLYGHERIGLRGKPFRCWKLRTMVCDGEAVLKAHLASDPNAQREWIETRKLTNDPRVTPLGQVLRTYSVDELPQLINVLFGEMSFVGPRPVVEEELERYGPYARAYLSARPGITGLWQTSGRSDTSYEYRVALDERYVREWSFTADVRILLRTVPVVLGARGSY
ncbi:MAG: sugar transferase [Pseudomonadota bacterium]